MDRLLRREEVAEVLNCSPGHVTNLTKSGLLKAIRLETAIRYRKEDIEQMLSENLEPQS